MRDALPRVRPGSLLRLLALAVAVSAAPAGADEDPARLPRTGHRDLVVDRGEHDFGAAPQDAVRTTTFTYTNRGTAPVEGIAARGECGCNVVSVSHPTLAPGASGTLEAEFNTLTLGGHLTKRIHLYSSDPSRGEVVIPLRIAIVEGMILRPAGLTYGDVRLGTRPTQSFQLKWYEGHGKPFAITSVEVPGFDFAVQITPYEDPKDPLWRGWSVSLGFEQAPPLGMFSAEVLVRTDDEHKPRLTLPLSANVCGKIWMQSRTLSFGAFTEGDERTATLKFRPFDDTVSFGEVRAVARKGRIEVEARPDPLHVEKGVWRLFGRVPQGTPAGSLDDEVIELHTGVPGEEVTLVQVRGTIRKPRGAPGDGR